MQALMKRLKMTSNFVKGIESFAGHKWDTYTVWSDFVEMAAISLSNTVYTRQRDLRNIRYQAIANKYSKNELEVFHKIFIDLVMDLEENPRDVLGEAFMELELGDKWKGQFFTPYSLANVMTNSIFTKEFIQKKVDDKGFVKLTDNSGCGGGVNMIAAFNHIRELGFNPQQMLVLEGVDVDHKACCMSYVQLSLLGANAVIRQRNGLAPSAMPDVDTWFTPFYILHGWKFKSILDDVVRDTRPVGDGNGQISFI